MMLKQWTITIISHIPRINIKRIPIILLLRFLFIGFIAYSIFQMLLKLFPTGPVPVW